MMALNTTLKCSRIGETGKPLGVIAVELRQHAIHLEKSAAHTLTSLDGLSSAAERLGRRETNDAEEGKAANAATVLGGAVARIGKAGDGVEKDLAAVARQGADVVDMLQRHDPVDAAPRDGFLGHAEDDRGRLVLRQGAAPACFISSRPRAPSSPMPVMITPMALEPAERAAERNSTSTDGRWRETRGPVLTDT
jgi:hypothetical protein